MGTIRSGRIRSGSLRGGRHLLGALSAVLTIALPGAAAASPLGNLILTVPGDYPTIQQAIDAAQGEIDPEVWLASNGIFDETLEVTGTVTLRAAPGFTPSVRGSHPTRAYTLRYRPNAGDGEDPIVLTLEDLTLLPRLGVTPGIAYTVLQVENYGQAPSRLVLQNVSIEDPLNASPDALSVRSIDTTVPNELYLTHSGFELAGGEGSQATGISWNSSGTAVLSDFDLAIGAGTGQGLDVRSPGDGVLDFWLENSTISVAAPSDSFSSGLLDLLGGVQATVRDNLFHLVDAPGNGGVSGIWLVASTPTSLVLERNRFSGTDFDSLGPALGVGVFSPGEASITAANNVVTGTGTGFFFNPQAGAPPARVTGTLVGNTIDGTFDDAILVGGQPGSEVDLTIADNLLTHAGRFGLEITALGTLQVGEHHNGYFANPSGDVAPPYAPGEGARLTDPLYVNHAGGDFRLQPASPMIDAGADAGTGVAATSAFDHTGAPRRTGSRADLGAFETPFACTRAVTTSHLGRHGTTGAMAVDRLRRTTFDSSFNNWQWLQVDFGCLGAFGGLRRFMTADGLAAEGIRSFQGEAVSTSLDGVVWTQVLASSSTGWEAYVNYLPYAWHSVPYGWSDWLRPSVPLPARYVRFHWDGNNDQLHEVELQFSPPLALFADGFESGSTTAWSVTIG